MPNPQAPGEMMEVFNLPLDLPTITNQVQELLTSIFKNRITKQKINGGNCIQVACCGLSRKLNLERDEDGNIIAAECMLPAWSKKFFTQYLKKGKKVVKTLEDATPHEEEYEYIDIEAMQKECPDLLRMVGYRIPTENKYSMLPLKVVGFLPQQNGSAIMLPADITLIAGSDFDVDKMYLRIPAIDKSYYNRTGKVRKLEYSLDELSGLTENNETWKATSKGNMTKEQRDNMMIDIEYAILASPFGSQQLYSPGNFDNLKKQKRISQILSSPNLTEQFVSVFGGYGHKEGNEIVYTEEEQNEIKEKALDASSILEILHQKDGSGKEKITIKDLDDFLEEYQTSINALIPSTFVYFHGQNMTGKALVGVFANGSSIHTKGQETNLKLAKGQEVKVNGKVLDNLHEQRRHDLVNGKLVETDFIQNVMAEF